MSQQTEKRMHIGSNVITKGNSSNLGIIIERPALNGFWVVRWLRGENRGHIRLYDENKLELAG